MGVICIDIISVPGLLKDFTLRKHVQMKQGSKNRSLEETIWHKVTNCYMSGQPLPHVTTHVGWSHVVTLAKNGRIPSSLSRSLYVQM